MEPPTGKKTSLRQRLDQGPVICAEGYLFELERRGYLQAGAFVPEVVLEHPELVAQLHREFVHAGSDVVEAFTYYAHREKLRDVGREGDLEAMNRAAVRIAREVAAEGGALVLRRPRAIATLPVRTISTAAFKVEGGGIEKDQVDFGKQIASTLEKLFFNQILQAAGCTQGLLAL